MIARPLLTAVALVTLLAAACTTEQSSNPAPTLTSTTSTTTTTTTTTTMVPADTTPPSSVAEPATSVETTMPAGPVDAVVALFAGVGEGGWLHLGSWQFDEWVEPSDDADDVTPVSPTVAVGTPATVSNLDGQTPGTFGEPAEACFDDRTGPTIDVDIGVDSSAGVGYTAIALPAPAWPLTPRPVAVSDRAPEAYAALGRSAFDAQPVDASLGAVDQLVVADLDGDGDDEAVVAFEYIQPTAGPGAPGDLAALLLVDTVTKQAATIERSFVDEDLDPDDFPIITRFRVLDVADLNGDGRMEVVVSAWYYEGASVIVYTYDGAELTEVLAAGCGA